MKKILLLGLLIFPFLIFSQDSENTLGYGCSYSGEPTPPVDRISDLLIAKNYKAIKKLLYSSNAVSNFLSVIIIEKLVTDKKLNLTEEDRKKIESLKQSKNIIEICGGCTFHETRSLTSLLNTKEDVDEAIEFFFSGKYIKLEK